MLSTKSLKKRFQYFLHIHYLCHKIPKLACLFNIQIINLYVSYKIYKTNLTKLAYEN